MADLNDYLRPPSISPGLRARSVAEVTRIRLGEDTVNTCNPGIGDVDGDGLDEIAIPFNRGETDVVALFRGDGAKVWETTAAPFYHTYYGDSERYRNTHWHYRSRHRHLLTAICDIDGDGMPEVIVGDGPIHTLDALTGKVKATLDLDGCVQLWAIGRLRPDGPPHIVACVNHHGESGEIVALSACGDVLWRHTTEGKSFEDKMLCGGLSGNGLDEIAFSMADAQRFEVRDAAGEILWAKSVPEEIGEDTHVDDLAIAEITGEGRQLATSTGGCLFDADGNLLWRLGDQIEHGQKIAVTTPPGCDGARIYINSKTGGRAYLLTGEGEVLWEYDNFSSTPDRGIYLTTAADWVDWSIGPTSGDDATVALGRPLPGRQSTPGTREIVQSEILIPPPELPAEEGSPVTLYLTILSPDGTEVAKLPYQDKLRPGFNGAMCAIACHARTRDRQDILVITHNSGEALVFSAV